MPLPKLIINLTEGSVSIVLSPATTRELLDFLLAFGEKIKEPSTGGKSTMEYRHIGDVFLEVFGNPNIYGNTFSAKVLLTIRDDKIRLTAEVSLTRLIEDVQQYLEQVTP